MSYDVTKLWCFDQSQSSQSLTRVTRHFPDDHYLLQANKSSHSSPEYQYSTSHLTTQASDWSVLSNAALWLVSTPFSLSSQPSSVTKLEKQFRDSWLLRPPVSPIGGRQQQVPSAGWRRAASDDNVTFRYFQYQRWSLHVDVDVYCVCVIIVNLSSRSWH